MKREMRFIPAGAGNIPRHVLSVFLTSVYPRWRGEHNTARFLNVKIAGLSPLARGTFELLVRERFNLRFIPAGAGNIAIATVSAAVIAVYPRWRGEHMVLPTDRTWYTGLSPLARGTSPSPWLQQFLLRFIPAGAGNMRQPGDHR